MEEEGVYLQPIIRKATPEWGSKLLTTRYYLHILPTYAQVRLWELSRAVRDARFLAGGIDGPHSSQTKSLFI